MKKITEEDIINSVADACQYISFYHPEDFVKAMTEAYNNEQSQAAKNAIGQILINSKMCAMGHRPLCQDTGSINIFIKIGLKAKLDISRNLEDILNEGVAKGYTDPNNTLRFSVVADPAGERKNTKNNTPAVIHYSVDATSDKVDITIAAKGGGSENKSKFTVLNPSDSIYDWVMENVKNMGAGWCPPGILGIGIGGNPEKSMLLAKEALMEHVDIHKLKQKGAKNAIEELRLKLYEDINKIGIGAQGLGGLTTVLDVKILDYPCHAASLPVAMIPNCAATRHIHFALDGNTITFNKPDLNIWPDIKLPMDTIKKVNIEDLTKEKLQEFKSGDTLLLSGKILTARDAAHKKIIEYKNANKTLPNGVDLKNRFIYYVGPVDPVKNEVVGPAGPTTSTRMDKFTKDMMEIGIMGMIGKAERKQATIDLIKEYKSIYLIATGGAAYLISQSIKNAKVLAFEEMGMEAIYEFEVKDMPVTVAVDTKGNSIHTTGPAKWRTI